MDALLHALRSPPTLFLASFLALCLAAWTGARHLTRLRAHVAAAREDFDVILGATLTLLALIIGFTFSMALSRYDQRKNLEEAEANAIGTEYLRADLLPEAEAGAVRGLLRDYLDARVAFYATRDARATAELDARTSRLQGQLWSAVRGPAAATPTPVMALVVGGMNDALNAQGYAAAAWSNRIPAAAWLLLGAIALGAVALVGVRLREPRQALGLLLILPLLVSIAFFLIADIDSPRRGLIRVVPQNLVSLAQSLATP
jgi:hypothetical protein